MLLVMLRGQLTKFLFFFSCYVYLMKTSTYKSVHSCAFSYTCRRMMGQSAYNLSIEFGHLMCFSLLFLLQSYFFFFFPFIFISWRLITLQNCSGFCHTLT